MTDFEERHGKVDISLPRSSAYVRDVYGRPVPAGAQTPEPRHALAIAATPSAELSRRVTSALDAGAYNTAALRSYAEWYLPPSTQPAAAQAITTSTTATSSSSALIVARATAAVRAVPTVEHFKQLSRAAGRKQEEYLWSLMQDVFADAEQADQYHPDVIGIETAQPHRRWFISHYAHLQAFLQRQPVLRRANLICRWLEATYRDESREEPRLRGEEDVVLRQLVLTFLRGGELHRAINAAVTYESCVHSCVLSAAQLQTVPEPWFSQTALVPLFGEYANGELEQAWCGNEYRLDNLSQLYEESIKYRGSGAPGAHGSSSQAAVDSVTDFDAIIGAALCGNLDVLENAFKVNGSWRDMAWCYLRCALVVAFTKQIMVATGNSGAVDRGYAIFIESMTGSSDDWATGFAQKLAQGLAARLQGTFLARASVEEQLQMRFILQTLTCMDGMSAALPPPIPSASTAVALSGQATVSWFEDIRVEANSDAARLVTHVLLAQDVAYGETLSPHAVQLTAGAALAAALAQYAVALAVLPRCPFDEGLRAVTAMTLRLRDTQHRAGVYAAFILAAREYELGRQRLLSASELEEQEARLVRQFVTADGDADVHAEVQRLLYQRMEPSTMLTHNELAEQLMWQAMHADSVADYVAVLRRGLQACCSFWLTQPQPEVEAIADVSGLLTRRVLLEMQRWTGLGDDGNGPLDITGSSPPASSLSPVTDLERSEATFWYVMSEARGIAMQHATVTAQLAAATHTAVFAGSAASSGRTLVYQLTQDEAALLERLLEHTRRAVRHGGAVVHRDRQCLTAIIALVQQLTEAVTLSLVSGQAEVDMKAESPAPRDELVRMQHVYALVEELHDAGYLDPALLPQQCAIDLYTQIQAMRVAYGKRVHQRQVVAALHQRARFGGASAATAADGGLGNETTSAIRAVATAEVEA